jgi:hypothetical protein
MVRCKKQWKKYVLCTCYSSLVTHISWSLSYVLFFFFFTSDTPASTPAACYATQPSVQPWQAAVVPMLKWPLLASTDCLLLAYLPCLLRLVDRLAL